MIDALRSLILRARSDEDDGSSSGHLGARGYAARDRYLAALTDHPTEFLSDFRRLLAREMEVDADALTPAALRGYFDRHVSFMGDPAGRILACVGALLAHFWELAERGRGPQLRAAIASGAAFVEQAAIDRGDLERAWLYTGLPEPRPVLSGGRATRRPGTALLPPRWLAAHISYMKDLEYLSQRSGASASSGAPAFGAAPPAGPPPAPKAKAKPKAKSGAAPPAP